MDHELLGGCWRVLGEAPSDGAVRRWRVVHSGTGELAEALTLRASASVDDRRAFLEVHRALLTVRDPALITTHAVLDDPETAIRAPLEDPTLADLMAPLPAEVVAAIGARLFPAVLAAGPATQGALLPTDVGLDATGAPLLAPRGRPLNRIDRAVSRAVAPEAQEGGTPDGASGLYGLGVLLYRLATGRELPWSGRDPTAPPAPPSTLRASVPLALDAPILRLLSRDPAERIAALPDLAGLAGALPDLRQYLRSTSTTLSAPRTPTAPTGSTATAGTIVLPAERLRQLGPAEKSAVAGWTRLPLVTVEQLADKGLPVSIEGVGDGSVARVRAVELSRESGFELLVVPERRPGLLPLAAGTAVASGALILLAVGLLAVGREALALLAFTCAVSVALFGSVAGVRSARSALRIRQARDAKHLVDAERDRLEASGLLRPAWSQIAALRRTIARSALPDTAAADLRALLRDIESHLASKADAAQATEAALASIDVARLRSRLAALEGRARTPSEVEERDRLARTLADVDDLLARRNAQVAEAERIAGSLEALGAIVARAGEAREGDLVELARAVAAIRETTLPTVPP